MASVPPDPDFEIRIVEEAERRQLEALVGKAVPAMSRSAGITEEDAEFVIRRVLDGMPSFLSDQEKHDIGGPYSLDRLTRDNRGGRPSDSEERVRDAIRQVRADGHKPTQERVAGVLYPAAKVPRDSLKKQLRTIEEVAGLTWFDLVKTTG